MKQQITFLLILITTSVFSQDNVYQYSVTAGASVLDLRPDSDGNVYAVGRGTIDPSCVDTSAVEYRGTAFLAKYDPAGNVVWRLNFGGQDATADALAIDIEGNILVTGNFKDTGDFSSTPTPTLTRTVPRLYVFLIKVTPNGEVLWLSTAGGGAGGSDLEVFDLDTDNDGNIYLTGSFNLTVDFGSIRLRSSSRHNPYIWALQSNGDTKWARNIPSSTLGEGHNISVNNDGDIVNVGEIYSETLEGFAIYISKYAPNGDQLFIKEINKPSSSRNNGLGIDSKNNIYLIGYLSGAIDFDPGPDEYILDAPNELRGDAYLLKLDKNGNFISVIRTGDDFSITWGGAIEIAANDHVFVSGAFRIKVDFDPGPGVVEVTTHEQYDKTYIQEFDSSGAFVAVYNPNKLHEVPGYEFNAFALSENGQFYVGKDRHGGPDIGFIDVYGDCPIILETEYINACGQYELGDISATNNCNYRTLLSDSTSGCGVISEMNVNIIPSRFIDVFISDSTLTSSINTNNIVWLDCNAGFEPILSTFGNHIFQPDQTGSSEVEVTLNNCPDTSDCFQIEVTTSNISEKENPFLKAEVFPNPFFDKLTLKNLPLAFAEISIFDLNGKLIFEKEKPFGASEIEISTTLFSKGIYLVALKNEDGLFRKKIVKN